MMNRLITLLTASCLLLALSFAAAGELKAGAAAPEFTLPDQDGELHSLDDYRDQWLVLYFYPKDDTPGCTTEACEFRDDIFKFRRMGCQVVGVSLDDTASHKAFAEKHGLPFPLLADTTGATAAAYGVKTTRGDMAFAKRQTFLIAPGGNIAKHYESVDPDSHAREVLADLAVLQADEVALSE
ncbi:MAG: peroxiredoxin [Woeseia sp.]